VLAQAVLHKNPMDAGKMVASSPGCCEGGLCSSCACVRAFVLYTLFPHDQSIWAMVKNPWWWLLTLIGIFPLWGVRVLWWLLVFLLKDKSDDYQLCSFVITFKATLFLASGLQVS
jgi:hypothetical protein